MSDDQEIEVNHIVKVLNQGLRYDGRKMLDYRNIQIEYGVSESAEGSARVKLGDTEVIAGVKMEVGEPYPDIPEEGVMMVGAELLPMSNPDFESGPPGIEAIELARVVDRGIRESGAIDFKKLCIRKNEKVWMVAVDICTINDSGDLLDCSGLAVLAALRDTNFPQLENDEVNYDEKTDQKLELTKLPIQVTVAKIGKNYLVDLSTEEEKALDARLTVTTLEDGTLCALQKGGDKQLTSEDINKMVGIAMDKSKQLREVLKSGSQKQ